MTKIVEYYLNKATYTAVDADGKKIEVKIDYWNNRFKLSSRNSELAEYAKKLLEKKHKVNYSYKIREELDN